MVTGRAAALISTCDQWVRASHHQTAVEKVGELTLSWAETRPSPMFFDWCRARGVATDRLCRIYRALDDVVERVAVGPTANGLDYSSLPASVPIIGPNEEARAAGADFAHPPQRPVGDIVGLAIDNNDRLFLADADAATISVIDMWSKRLLRTIQIATPTHPDRRPAGLTTDGDRVVAVLQNPEGLIELTATRGPEPVDLPRQGVPVDGVPRRVGLFEDGTPAVLFDDAWGFAWIAAIGVNARWVGAASDLIVRQGDEGDFVIVAPCPDPLGRATLRQFSRVGDEWNRERPLDASGYDGNGIVVTRDGRVGFFTTAGRFRLAVGAEVFYKTEGHCITYRLDAGVARNKWGRVLIEACVPDGTQVLIGALTSDDEYVAEIPHQQSEPRGCPTETDNPGPLPSPTLVPVIAEAGDLAKPMHTRSGLVTPWIRADDVYHTLEAPLDAPAGRYLWLTVALRGNQRRTPRVREVRIERQAHGHMRRLPALFSADKPQAEFLERYLAMPDGLMHDLELRARCRDILVDPHSAPAEALDWLASFVGLTLDHRWAEAAQRKLIAEIVPLYRYRGTQWALSRYIEIYLMGENALDPAWRPVQPIIVEHFRLRGIGGPLLTEDTNLATRAVLGAGFRVGGTVGEPGSRPLDGGDATQAYESHAHRFTVLIPRPLGADEDAAVRFILETERPAHTVYDICTVDAGMRVGNGVHVGMSSIVGPTGAFEFAMTDRSLIGRGAILGGPSTGIAVEASRIGQNARVG